METNMTYSESAEGIKIDGPRALRELADHGITRSSPDFEEFRVEFPASAFPILASDLLAWLGY